MYFTKAKLDNLDEIYNIIEIARKHIATFKIDQWQDGHPSIEQIKNDIINSNGYIVKENEEIIAYFALLDDDYYYNLYDIWLSNKPYKAIHRMASKYQDKGLGTLIFKELQKQYDHIKIDTHVGNISMNKCLLKNGFVSHGDIVIADGMHRIAYEYVKEQSC